MRAHSAALRVSGRRVARYWLPAARVAWIAALALAVGLFVAGIPVIVPELRTPCDGAACWSWQISGRGVAPSQLTIYALYKVAVEGLMLGGFSAIGAIIALRRPDEPVALLAAFALVTFAAALSDVLRALAVTAPLWLTLRDVLASLGWASLFLLFYLFPDGKFAPRWTRIAAAAWLLFIALHYVTPPAWGLSSPSAAEARGSTGQRLFGIGLIAFFCTVAAAQVYRYRRISTETQRQQTKWVIMGFVAALGGFIAIVGWAPLVVHDLSTFDAELVGLALFSGVLLLLPLSLALAILRYRLWEIDLIINRALVYGGLTAGVVLLYVLVVGYLGVIFRTGGNLAISLVATGLVAVLFQPARERLQRSVNRLMYGEADDPYVVLSRLGQRLEGSVAVGDVLPLVVETLAAALKLPFAEITLDGRGETTTAASVGSPIGALLTIPLSHRGETVGRLTVAPRAGERAFSAADRRLLEDLARQAGAAAHGVRLTAELQRSRERLVTAREEERRRIRRDLHDGLGPALASLMLKINTARRRLEPGSPAEPVLREVREDIQNSIAGIRRLVYDLRPPALDELGLLGAIHEAAVDFEGEGRRVALHLPEALPPLPAAVEVAAYRIVGEALTNVARHAGARACTIRLSLSDGLELEVADDGVGLGAGRHTGVGLTSMRERAAEVGGRCTVESLPGGGTLVRARLPLPELHDPFPTGTQAGQPPTATS